MFNILTQKFNQGLLSFDSEGRLINYDCVKESCFCYIENELNKVKRVKDLFLVTLPLMYLMVKGSFISKLQEMNEEACSRIWDIGKEYIKINLSAKNISNDKLKDLTRFMYFLFISCGLHFKVQKYSENENKEFFNEIGDFVMAHLWNSNYYQDQRFCNFFYSLVGYKVRPFLLNMLHVFHGNNLLEMSRQGSRGNQA